MTVATLTGLTEITVTYLTSSGVTLLQASDFVTNLELAPAENIAIIAPNQIELTFPVNIDGDETLIYSGVTPGFQSPQSIGYA